MEKMNPWPTRHDDNKPDHVLTPSRMVTATTTPPDIYLVIMMQNASPAQIGPALVCTALSSPHAHLAEGFYHRAEMNPVRLLPNISAQNSTRKGV